MTSRLQSSGIAALSFTLSAAVLALALTPGVAAAQTNFLGDIELTAPGDRIVEERRVNTAGVDFNNAADMKKLDARIGRAITAVCAGQDLSLVKTAEMQCRQVARLSTDRQLAMLRNEAIALAAAGRAAPRASVIVVAAR
ncbi:UrcA family protein [Sphingomonas sp. LHG3443-2]|uniref:UrcA family protein n=1 Tax=Sphingomonas sp. LHG3443-2 TaxID=2804639 RepID=UPI003CF3B2D7